ncbi:MAG TPA: hypothetical protein ENI70_01070 [Candidatus Peregrinibacteria bacterium]|nr:hypothetical protein [Candidatus Peregrinibacteria bacterium]
MKWKLLLVGFVLASCFFHIGGCNESWENTDKVKKNEELAKYAWFSEADITLGSFTKVEEPGFFNACGAYGFSWETSVTGGPPGIVLKLIDCKIELETENFLAMKPRLNITKLGNNYILGTGDTESGVIGFKKDYSDYTISSFQRGATLLSIVVFDTFDIESPAMLMLKKFTLTFVAGEKVMTKVYELRKEFSYSSTETFGKYFLLHRMQYVSQLAGLVSLKVTFSPLHYSSQYFCNHEWEWQVEVIEEGDYRIYQSYQRAVTDNELDAGEFSVDTDALPPGIYFFSAKRRYDREFSPRLEVRVE